MGKMVVIRWATPSGPDRRCSRCLTMRNRAASSNATRRSSALLGYLAGARRIQPLTTQEYHRS